MQLLVLLLLVASSALYAQPKFPIQPSAAPSIPYSEPFSALANSATLRVAHNQNTTDNEVTCRTTAGASIAVTIPDANRNVNFTDVVFPGSGGPFTGKCRSVASGAGKKGDTGDTGPIGQTGSTGSQGQIGPGAASCQVAFSGQQSISTPLSSCTGGFSNPARAYCIDGGGNRTEPNLAGTDPFVIDHGAGRTYTGTCYAVGEAGVTKAQIGLGNVPNTDATARANHTGTQLANTISDFGTAARAAITKSDVGLGNVDNTADASKSVALAAALSANPSNCSAGFAANGITAAGVGENCIDLPGTYLTKTACINTQSGTAYTLLASDNGCTVVFNNASAVTLTVPTGLGAGFNALIVQMGTGNVTPTASGTTLSQRQSFTQAAGRYAAFTLIATSANTFVMSGDMQ